MSNFKILNLPDNANKDAIKKAYKKLAKELHPDVNGGDEKKTKKFIQIKDAYDNLLKGITGIKPNENNIKYSKKDFYRYKESFEILNGKYDINGNLKLSIKLQYIQKIYLSKTDIYWDIDSTSVKGLLTIKKEYLKKLNYEIEFRAIGWLTGNSIYKKIKIKKPIKKGIFKIIEDIGKFIDYIF